jgi:hypothetical protein
MGLLHWFRRRFRTVEPVDAWAPPLGSGEWRTTYAECCDAVLAYRRVVMTVDPGPVRERLDNLCQQLPPLLAVAERLATIGETVSPATPRRAADIPADLGPTPAEDAMEHLYGLRDALWGLADNSARVALRLRENPAATDVGTILTALGAGLAEARRHAWTPIGHRTDSQ